MGRIPRDRVRALRDRELERFSELRPLSGELTGRAQASMPNGVPTTWMVSLYSHPPIVVKRGSGGSFLDVDGNTHAGELPSNAIQARGTFDVELYELQRLYMANRGIWEAISSAGPACGIQTTTEDVDRYLEVLDDFLSEVQP